MLPSNIRFNPLYLRISLLADFKKRTFLCSRGRGKICCLSSLIKANLSKNTKPAKNLRDLRALRGKKSASSA